ncbi:hypothetical protein [Sulfurihydrogenibium subterraneum]|uniref:hypothetical protein n=1 Tax=Sulfurihydrogenibium subterraneum TaxID=171121 RepID=UPI00048E2099|nr:hypothetical protein [Sulfurihydrogenibium subterraneum]
MRKSEKILIFTIIFLIIFSIGTAIVIRALQEFKEGSDLAPFLVVVFARLSTLLGFLAIMSALFLRGAFRNIEKPKTDLLELEEKIQNAEKEKREHKSSQ